MDTSFSDDEDYLFYKNKIYRAHTVTVDRYHRATEYCAMCDVKDCYVNPNCLKSDDSIRIEQLKCYSHVRKDKKTIIWKYLKGLSKIPTLPPPSELELQILQTIL